MTGIPDILKKILARKAEEIVERSQHFSMQMLIDQVAGAPSPRGFAAAIENRAQRDQLAVIAEIKKASPSKGVLRENFDAALIAHDYATHGATCLSVLTDRDFFQGGGEYLWQARTACKIPLLCKDFLIDPYQIYEARAWGADAVLLIVAALGDSQLADLAGLATQLGMDVLIEVHNEEELARALTLPVSLIGINNRNLHTFETRLETSLDLLPKIPADRTAVSESGITAPQDIMRLRSAGIRAFLIGETLMKSARPGEALAQLLSEI